MDRRSFLRAGLTTMGVAGMASINPGFFISSAFASQQKTMVFLSAENITGNWDPTAHTTLSQSTVAFGTDTGMCIAVLYGIS